MTNVRSANAQTATRNARNLGLLAGATLMVLGSPAWASKPSWRAAEPRAGIYEVKKLSRQLDRSADRLYRNAAHYVRHGHRGQREAFRDLKALSQCADEFRRYVDYYHRDPQRVDRSYYGLKRAFHEADRSFHRVRSFYPVEDEFYRVAATMNELAYYLEGTSQRNRRDRYDRGSYDRNQRWRYERRKRDRSGFHLRFGKYDGLRIEIRDDWPDNRRWRRDRKEDD